MVESKIVKRMIQTEFVRIRIDKEKRKWLKNKAKKDRTTVSGLLRDIIAKEMNEDERSN